MVTATIVVQMAAQPAQTAELKSAMMGIEMTMMSVRMTARCKKRTTMEIGAQPAKRMPVGCVMAIIRFNVGRMVKAVAWTINAAAVLVMLVGSAGRRIHRNAWRMA